MEKLDLEKELYVRHDVAVKVRELIKELNVTIAFVKHKLSYIADSHFVSNDFIIPLLDIINEEQENCRNRIRSLAKIKRSAILPLPEIEQVDIQNCWDIYSVIDKTSQDVKLNKENNMFKSQFTLTKCREMEYHEAKELDDDKIAKAFCNMRKRYAKDQKKKHEIMREETCSPKDSFRDLINSGKNIPQVKIWNNTDHDLLKTIAEMKENNMTEKDLLPLIDYLDKYDYLKKMMDDEKPTRKTPPKRYTKNDTEEDLKKLSSEEAEEIWKRLRKEGIVDKHNQPIDLSWSQQSQLANKIAEKLDIKNLWCVFGIYWKISAPALKSSFGKSKDYASTGTFIDKMNKLLR